MLNLHNTSHNASASCTRATRLTMRRPAIGIDRRKKIHRERETLIRADSRRCFVFFLFSIGGGGGWIDPHEEWQH